MTPVPHHTIITTTSLDDLSSHASTWMRCREGAAIRSINNHPALFEATVRAMGDEVQPFVLRIDEDRAPAGMILGRLSRRRHEQRLGYATVKGPMLNVLDVVYGGVMTAREDDAAMLEALSAALHDALAELGVDLVVFNHLPIEQAVVFDPRSSRVVGGECNTDESADAAPHWRLEAENGGFAHVFSRQSKKHRGNLRRAERKLGERMGATVELRAITDEAELDRFLASARTITEAGYQASFSPFAREDSAMAAVLRAAAEQLDALCCYELVAGDRTIAYQAGVIIDGAYHLIATAYDPEFAAFSPGQILLTRVLGDVEERGVKAVDYGFGDAAYKRSYGSACTYERTVAMHGAGLRSRADQLLTGACAGVASLVRNAPSDGAVVARIKRNWRRALREKAA